MMNREQTLLLAVWGALVVALCLVALALAEAALRLNRRTRRWLILAREGYRRLVAIKQARIAALEGQIAELRQQLASADQGIRERTWERDRLRQERDTQIQTSDWQAQEIARLQARIAGMVEADAQATVEYRQLIHRIGLQLDELARECPAAEPIRTTLEAYRR